MNKVAEIRKELEKYIDDEKAEFLPRFFKTGEGEYGEGDKFIGVTVPNQKKVVQKFYKEATLDDAVELLHSEIHEHRLTALLLLVKKFERSKDEDHKEKIYSLYIENTDCVNNWDLVDSSAHKIMGPYLEERDKGILYEFAEMDNLWKQRIAIITTYHFIKNREYDDALKISEMLLNHEHDLIHKAVGWMLREIGNRDYQVEYDFLERFYNEMPRTMLRYSIEKFNENIRKKFLKGEI
ncbi:3-methyladenine DNA glycosylase AlkD [Dethiosulfatibacter aminovorans DSM 17477]|uniref:3-methyladenine DNA glycosylase AlkD n=1 Tax=Dethiosulfatibacter aminovorans DSM 17477 TaxID=1121476 RepID=A0A1M6J9Z1_9FIRM|nr:DNA alkylation repair protein [Dethiosulfatibacter aminovorans]SHJ43503.1 3-methyladenine DNA glycosylase AlkD [Dethiosulfatibacter aminovorans DSM 17477]